MRQLLSLAVGIIVATGLVVAQSHNNMTEKAVKAEIKLSADTRVGTTVLKAGTYRVECDKTTVTFTRVDEGKDVKVLQVPCNGKELSKPADQTSVETSVDASGVRFIEKMLLRGSTIEHTF